MQKRLQSAEFYVNLIIKKLRLDPSSHRLTVSNDLSVAFNNELSEKVNLKSPSTQHLITVENCFEHAWGCPENFDFSELFIRNSADLINQVFLGLLLERKVILVGSSPSKNAQMIETLKKLLFPLSWSCQTISNLSYQLIDYLEAPFPYLVSISPETWAKVQEKRFQNFDEDVIVLDIEKQVIHQKSELPQIPGILEQNFLSKLQDLIDDLRECLGLSPQRKGMLSRLASFFVVYGPEMEVSKLELSKQQQIVSKFTKKVKRLFLNYMFSLIGDTQDYTSQSSLCHSSP